MCRKFSCRVFRQFHLPIIFTYRKNSRDKSCDSGYRNQQTQLPLRGQYWLIPVSRLMLRRLSNRFFQVKNQRTPKSRADGRADTRRAQEKRRKNAPLIAIVQFT